MMAIEEHVPRYAEVHGFRINPTGTHLSSTLRLEELQLLLARVPHSAKEPDYREAIIDLNVLGKSTVGYRRTVFARLRELYGLDPGLLIFRALLDLWDTDTSAQPKIALMCSTARDPILRALTPLAIRIPVNEAVDKDELYEEAEYQFPGKFVPSSRLRLGRNVASSWEKAGLLKGHHSKTRAKPIVRPTSLAYALFLGDLCGRRGQALFTTLWANMLDAPIHELKAQAVIASRQGWIEYRAAGDVVEVSFRHLMRDQGDPAL